MNKYQDQNRSMEHNKMQEMDMKHEMKKEPECKEMDMGMKNEMKMDRESEEMEMERNMDISRKMNEDAPIPANRRRLLRRIQALEFVLVDTGLFLDGHPTNRRALSYYNKMSEEHKRAKELYEKTYGPLTYGANQDNNRWQWIDGPWPWESED